MYKLDESEIVGTNESGCTLAMTRNEFNLICRMESWNVQRVNDSLIAYNNDNLAPAIHNMDKKRAIFLSSPIEVS